MNTVIKAKALLARAKEIVLETSDAGEEQHKLLALVMIEFGRQQVLKAAKEEASKMGLEYLRETLNSLEMLPELAARAKSLAINNLDFAEIALPLIERIP